MEYILFDGESHGWKKSETIKRALEAERSTAKLLTEKLEEASRKATVLENELPKWEGERRFLREKISDLETEISRLGTTNSHHTIVQCICVR